VMTWSAGGLLPALGYAGLAVMLTACAVMGMRKLRKQT
jgi:hypothetical protein